MQVAVKVVVSEEDDKYLEMITIYLLSLSTLIIPKLQ
jgi:hypothetical protein